LGFLDFDLLDLLDIILVTALLNQLYKLVQGTVAIKIFIGLAATYLFWKLVGALQMEVLSEILGQFIGVGVLAVIIVFQQEIRKFLLMLGTTNFTSKRNFLKQLKFLNPETKIETDVDTLVNACETMGRSKTGALIVLERGQSLDFVKVTGDKMNIEINQPILESIFFKNSPLHDGAAIINNNTVVATRVVLPLSNKDLPSRFGLRHRAAVGITEKTDALCLVVSEETGKISYIKDGDFVLFDSTFSLVETLRSDLT